MLLCALSRKAICLRQKKTVSSAVSGTPNLRSFAALMKKRNLIFVSGQVHEILTVKIISDLFNQFFVGSVILLPAAAGTAVGVFCFQYFCIENKPRICYNGLIPQKRKEAVYDVLQ